MDQAVGEVAKEIDHGTSMEIKAQARKKMPARPRAAGRPAGKVAKPGEAKVLDYRALRPLVREAARSAFTEVRMKRPKERFYGFALHTTAEGEIVPSVNSEEGLERRRVAELRKGRNSRTEDLRWNASAWAYHRTGERYFAAAKAMLASGPGLDGLAPVELEQHLARVLAMCSAALSELDEEGFFGRGSARDGVTLLVTLEDAAPELLAEIAKQINPPAAAARILAASAAIPRTRRRRR